MFSEYHKNVLVNENIPGELVNWIIIVWCLLKFNFEAKSDI